MSIQNIRMRKKSGNDWVIVHPETSSANVKNTDGTDVQSFINNVYNNTASPTKNGSMSMQDKAKLDTVAMNANDYVHPNNPSERHVTDIQITDWNDKYTKSEVNGLINKLTTGLDWKEAVPTFSDLTTTYTSPVNGWTASTKDTDITYRYDGTAWIAISANSIPLASKITDGKMSKQDKANLDNLLPTVTSLVNDLNSLKVDSGGNIKAMDIAINNNKALSSKNKGDILTLITGKSDITHNHDLVYSKLGHNHDLVYSKLNHNHDSRYISKTDGISLSDLHIKKDGDKQLDFMNNDGTITSNIKSTSDGDLYINSAQGKNVIIRTYGNDNSSNQFVISKDNVYFNGSSLIAGKGDIDGVGSIGNVIFDLDQETGNMKVVPFDRGDVSKADDSIYLRNDNTWHKILPTDIGAADKIHTHVLKDITDFPTGAKGEMLICDSDDNKLKATKLLNIIPAICRYTIRLEYYKEACVKSGAVFIVDVEASNLYEYVNAAWVMTKINNVYDYLGVGTLAKDSISGAVYYVGTVNLTALVDVYFSGSIRYKVDPWLINQTPTFRLVTDVEKNTWGNKASTALASTGSNGLMSMADKSKLDSIMEASSMIKKHSTTIGDGVTTGFVITHGIGNNDLSVTVKDIATSEIVLADVYINSNGIVNVLFANAPTPNQYRVVIIG